ncbi:MAG: TolC family protein [bacterium]|nr:TolC family protein [bacterium]
MKNKIRIITGLMFCFLCFNSIYAEDSLTFSLDDAVNYALKHNESMKIEQAGVKSADAGTMIAGAGFLPKVSASASYTRLAETSSLEMANPEVQVIPDSTSPTGVWFKTIGYTISSFEMGQLENYVTQLTVQQPIFTWGKIISGYQISKLNLDATKEDYKKNKNELILNVTKAFYGIIVLEEFVKITEDAYKQMQSHAGVIEKRYNEGLASKFDLLRTKVQLTNMEPQLIKAKDGLELAKNGFKLLLGLKQNENIKLEGALNYEPITIELEKSTKAAQVNRPEIKSMNMRKEMAKKALFINRTSNLPNIVAIGNYYYEKPLYFSNEWGTTWNVTLAAQMQIFSGFENLGRVRQASYQLSQAEHGLNLIKEGIKMEVQSTYLQLEQAKKLVTSQKENISQAEEALKIVEQRYNNGLATSLEVMDTQLALMQAKTNRLQALSDYVIAKCAFEKAVGGK